LRIYLPKETCPNDVSEGAPKVLGAQ
jgi:hypothetical protein